MKGLYQYGISNYCIMPFPELVTTLSNVFVWKSRMLVNHEIKAKSTLCDLFLYQSEEEVPVW